MILSVAARNCCNCNAAIWAANVALAIGKLSIDLFSRNPVICSFQNSEDAIQNAVNTGGSAWSTTELISAAPRQSEICVKFSVFHTFF